MECGSAAKWRSMRLNVPRIRLLPTIEFTTMRWASDISSEVIGRTGAARGGGVIMMRQRREPSVENVHIYMTCLLSSTVARAREARARERRVRPTLHQQTCRFSPARRGTTRMTWRYASDGRATLAFCVAMRSARGNGRNTPRFQGGEEIGLVWSRGQKRPNHQRAPNHADTVSARFYWSYNARGHILWALTTCRRIKEARRTLCRAARSGFSLHSIHVAYSCIMCIQIY